MGRWMTPEEKARILRLAREGWDNLSISLAVGCSPGTVSTMKSKARRKGIEMPSKRIHSGTAAMKGIVWRNGLPKNQDEEPLDKKEERG